MTMADFKDTLFTYPKICEYLEWGVKYPTTPIPVEKTFIHIGKHRIQVLIEYATEAPHHKEYGYAQTLKVLMGDKRYEEYLNSLDPDDKYVFEGVDY